MNSKLSEILKVYGQGSDDIDTADLTSAIYRDVANAGRILVQAETVTQLTVGKILTLQLKQAKDAAGTDAKDLGTAVTFTAAGTEVAKVVAEKVAADLDTANGFTHVGFTVGTDLGSAVIASVVTILGELAYSNPIVE